MEHDNSLPQAILKMGSSSSPANLEWQQRSFHLQKPGVPCSRLPPFQAHHCRHLPSTLVVPTPVCPSTRSWCVLKRRANGGGSQWHLFSTLSIKKGGGGGKKEEEEEGKKEVRLGPILCTLNVNHPPGCLMGQSEPPWLPSCSMFLWARERVCGWGRGSEPLWMFLAPPLSRAWRELAAGRFLGGQTPGKDRGGFFKVVEHGNTERRGSCSCCPSLLLGVTAPATLP